MVQTYSSNALLLFMIAVVALRGIASQEEIDDSSSQPQAENSEYSNTEPEPQAPEESNQYDFAHSEQQEGAESVPGKCDVDSNCDNLGMTL